MIKKYNKKFNFNHFPNTSILAGVILYVISPQTVNLSTYGLLFAPFVESTDAMSTANNSNNLVSNPSPGLVGPNAPFPKTHKYNAFPQYLYSSYPGCPKCKCFMFANLTVSFATQFAKSGLNNLSLGAKFSLQISVNLFTSLNKPNCL